MRFGKRGLSQEVSDMAGIEEMVHMNDIENIENNQLKRAPMRFGKRIPQDFYDYQVHLLICKMDDCQFRKCFLLLKIWETFLCIAAIESINSISIV